MSKKISLEIQENEVGESVRARFSMVASILRAMLYSTKKTRVKKLGGATKITLEDLAIIYQEGDGDFGVCFEYAIHDAIRERHKSIYPLIEEVLFDFCKIKGTAESILFGLEKNGSLNIVQTAKNSLTDESRILVGKVGKPPYLRDRISDLQRAFRDKQHRSALPQSIRGLWQADLFLGSPATEQWVGTTLKLTKEELQHAPGLRVGVYPSNKKEGPSKNISKNMIICPLPYRSDFMILFQASFQIARQIMASKGRMPKPPAIVYEDDIVVAEWITARRTFAVMDILEALVPLMQPGLTKTETSQESITDDDTEAFAPMPLID
ncbi:hypothetical protein [Myxococcus landrumensis]|uniref:Uncharacterized protein n=1 Tax=Myxococcus landrumensis TaxID=2813577 RepID=A0ABX7NIH5_9BACT|nr:hypothetical protein [Myxococcus landrumus]QSQ17191.1 hypothetical protein JY572_14500 [Myxococcus landrumus]